MKNIIILSVVLMIFLGENIGSAQQLNWRNYHDSKNHIANINIGWDYGMVIGLGYGQNLKTKIPVILNAEYSFPFGNQVFDDFKAKLGGQAAIFINYNLAVSLKVYGIFRRYQNPMVRLASFGSEFSGSFGYYRPKWYVSGEFGFDKAIATQIKHSNLMLEYNPTVQNGWYVPTGGNYFYGLLSGYSFNSNEINIKAGMMVTQDFKTKPMTPYYAKLGYIRKF
jgi:hypothetical protein